MIQLCTRRNKKPEKHCTHQINGIRSQEPSSRDGWDAHVTVTNAHARGGSEAASHRRFHGGKDVSQLSL